MTRYRVTAKITGKRVATRKYWETREGAERYAYETNKDYRGAANARVVKDSEKVRKMIP